MSDVSPAYLLQIGGIPYIQG